MTRYVQIETTTDSQEEADRLAKELVGQRLAACVQTLGPMTSTYWWEGQIEQSKEFLLLCKTTEDHIEQVKAAISDIHSYDVPEILVLPIQSGAEKYLEWIGSETRSSAP